MSKKLIVKLTKIYFFLLSLGSLMFINESNYRLTNVLSELFLLLLFIFVLFSQEGIKIRRFLLSLTSIMFIIITFFIAIGLDNNYEINVSRLKDFLMINKSLIYLSMLLLIGNAHAFNEKDIRCIYLIVGLSLLLKYSVSKFIFGEDRPWLFTENNFEMIFLIVIYYSSWLSSRKVFPVDLILLLSLLVISGSRSALACGVFVLALMFISFKKFDFLLLIKIATITVFTFVFVVIFIDRLAGHNITSIDRVVFLSYFLNEISSWTIANYLFGTAPITELSANTCQSLTFYSSLFSYENSNTCYSVILHSYILRVLYDFGLIGMIYIFGVLFYILRNNLDIKESLTILGVIFLTGLSISSLNSTYVIISILILMLTKIKSEYKL